MKKVILSLAVLFSVAMVSCGGNKNAEANADSAVVVEEAVEEVVAVDTAAPAADSTVATADSAAPAEAAPAAAN